MLEYISFVCFFNSKGEGVSVGGSPCLAAYFLVFLGADFLFLSRPFAASKGH